MTAPQFNTSAEAFMWSALVQECRNSPHLQNVDFSKASLSFVREMLNHNTALEINKIPILLSKYIIRLVLVNVKPFIPSALSAHLKPENIRVEIESDELQLLLTRRQSAKPSLVTLVAKNTLCAMIGSSLDALRTVLIDGADKRSVHPTQPPRVTPITVVEPEPIAVPPRSVPGQFTDVFDATGLDRVAPSPARSGPTGATSVDESEMEVYPRSEKRFATPDRSLLGSASDVSGSVAVQPGSFVGGEGTPELDPVDAESNDDDGGGDDDEEEDSSAGDAGNDRDRVYDLNALYGAAEGNDEFASSGYGDGDVEDDSGGDDGDSGTEEIPIADPAGGDGHDDNRTEKVLLGAKLMASAPDFTELVTRKRSYSQISDGSRSPGAPIVADSDLPAVERSRKRLAIAAKSGPGIGPFVVIASGDDSDDGTATSPRKVTDAHDKPISAGGEGINSPGGSRLPSTGVRTLPGSYTGGDGNDADDDDDGDELF